MDLSPFAIDVSPFAIDEHLLKAASNWKDDDVE